MIDTNKIKKITNNLIACENYEKERKMKNKKLKNTAFIFLALFIVIGGTISVDAATDNKISNAIKDMITVKVNGQDKNAKCEKLSNGNIKCSLDKEVINGNETTFEYNTNLMDPPEITVNQTDETDEVHMILKDKKN